MREPESSSVRLRDALLLVVVVLAVLLPGTGSLPLLDRDEPRFATATREMVERREWVVPTFDGAPRYDKPVLVYWVMRLGYSLFGTGELGARFPSLLATLLLVLGVRFGAGRFVSRRAALTAAFALATTLQVAVHGRLALADALMVAAVCASQLALARLLLAEEAPRGGGAWWTLWVALGLGFLAKGPIAWAVPALSLLLLRWVLWRRPLPWSRLRAGRGALVCLALVAAWGVPALARTGGDFLRVGVGRHVVERGLGAFDDRGYSPLFYLWTAPLSLFPWIATAPLVVVSLRRRRDAWTRWLLAWLLAPYLVFTPYATQLPHYVLPGFPAFALLVGAALEEPAPGRRSRAVHVALALAALLPALGAAWLATRAVPAAAEELRTGAAAAALLPAGLAAAALAWSARRRLLVAPALLTVAAATAVAATSLRDVHATLAVARAVASAPQEARCFALGVHEPSMVFYTRRHWEALEASDAAERLAAAAREGPAVLAALAREARPERLLGEEAARSWRELEGVAGLEAALAAAGWSRERVEGFAPGRSRWQVIDVWRSP